VLAGRPINKRSDLVAHSSQAIELPPGQQLVAADKWPLVGERAPSSTTAPWRLTIGGLVERPLAMSLDQLLELPLVEREIDIHCVTRWSKPGVRFRGVELADLLARAQPPGEARFISFTARSDRRHSTSLPLADALSLKAFVAVDVAGRALPIEHGGPLRLVVPRRYFYKSLKWLEHIELLAEDRLGYWESEAGYHNHADYWEEERYLASGITAADARAILAERDIRGRDLMGLTAAGLELPALRAEGALLRNADFRGANLMNAGFDGANLTNAHFEQAQLQGASFRGADLEGANFAGANLSGACLLADSMVATSFTDPGIAGGAVFDASTEIAASRYEDLAPAEQAYLQQQPLCFKEQP
jgi:DMSO/TMAO reductase YedYZ molybdopterin-dependent catalytic subunit